MVLVCDAGSIGMLLNDSGWDWLFLTMVVVPLAFGAWF